MSRPAARCGRSSYSTTPLISEQPPLDDVARLCRACLPHMSGSRRALAERITCLGFALVWSASVAQAAATVETGAAVYQDYCSSCHGENLRNTSGGVTFDLRRLRAQDH